MNKIKLIFTQTLMISTAILFGIGIQLLLIHFTSGRREMTWIWYTPLSIVFTGFLCSIPTVFLLGMDNLSRTAIWTRIGIHFLCIGGLVSLCGYLFKWYDSLNEYLPILVMYVLIYFFVWCTTIWMAKTDEKKINEAIKDFQDEE